MGAKYQGYCSDLTRTISLGSLNSKQREIFAVVFAAQQKALMAIRPGMRAAEIDEIARMHIADCGYGQYFPHITGHGLGISIHEAPILNAQTDLLLKPNMVLTVEPGIYVKGAGAARVEDMVLVTEHGYEVLTKSIYDLI
jgi:Xaa-Pro aminopeptidase